LIVYSYIPKDLKGEVSLVARTAAGKFSAQANVDASQAFKGTMIHKLAARSMIRVRMTYCTVNLSVGFRRRKKLLPRRQGSNKWN
jgi:hypothetical protein